MPQHILPSVTQLPPAPTRQSPVDFDARADAFLTALVLLSQEIDAWAAAFNAMTDAYNQQFIDWTDELNARAAVFNKKFMNRDSRLNALEAEIFAARSGADSVRGRIKALSEQINNIALSQNALLQDKISVTMDRPPMPTDDGYAVGMYWVCGDDIWCCTSTATGHARWRACGAGSLYQVIYRIPAPMLYGTTAGNTTMSLTLKLHGVDPDAREIRWTAAGSPSVVSGALTGSTDAEITLQWEAEGNYAVSARVMGDNVTRYDSLTSNVVNVYIGQCNWCGSGSYCGDGTWCGGIIGG